MALQPESPNGSAVRCLIAYGSNLSSGLGGRQELVGTALSALSTNGIRILQKSGHFRSSAYPPGSGPDFVNGVVLAETDLDATGTLAVLHDIEASLGRDRRERWAARVIDLDLIDFGAQVHPDAITHQHWRNLPPEQQSSEAPDRMLLPHPRVQDRAFVLVPLRVVAPDWRHPVTGQAVDQMIAALDPADVADVRPIEGD